MELKIGLNSKPKFTDTFMYALQWFVITIPAVVIIGKVLAEMTYSEPVLQILYMQRLFFVTGLLMIIQPLFGHKLPLISGPSSVLLIGIIASSSSGADAVYTSIFAGGLLLALISFTGLFSYIQKFFTLRVVSVILLLIAFTLLPVILKLIFTGPLSPPSLLAAALVFLLLMYKFNSVLKGLWKSVVVIGGIVVATVFFRLAGYFGVYEGFSFLPASPFSRLSISFAVDGGVMLAFFFCFMALAINDIGSIQSLRSIPGADDMEKRTARGMGVTGLANSLSGLLGVVGPVNFSLSPGVIASTGCASRFTVVPAGFAFLVFSALPFAVAFVSDLPAPVVGIVLLYLMGSQFSAGIMMITEMEEKVKFNEGVILGVPLLLAVIISFLPDSVVSGFPGMLRPIIGNGFVMGVLCVIILEHWILKEKPALS
ncbi:MAG: solute carrier family 23 protein [Spirochaetota bacterium]